MVEKINATIFKDSVDTKVGIILVAKDDGKVYVKSTSGLFGATALQAGDEVVTINGNLVEGMTSTECVGIIKSAEGDVTIIAKRGVTMVETINATIYKDSVDTKVGIILVTKDDGKVYVKSTSGLFGATALQAGDEIVTINGNLVEGMISSECVGIIKAAEGDVTIIAKRGAAIGEAAPGKAPAGGVWGTLKYAGSDTQMKACLACLCCGPLGLCILACPTDEKDAYCVGNKVYDAAGTYICPKDDKFTPARPRN